MRRPIMMFLASAIMASTAAAQASTVILVRHGEKASQTETDPILSAAGVQRAKDLAAALADGGVTTVITTQWKRTRATAAPFVAATHPKTMIVNDSAGIYKHIADMVATIMARPAGDVVLVVGHSNTIPRIVGALGGPKMLDLCDSQYSTMFILEMNGTNPPRLIRATYGKEDPPDSCRNRKP